VVIVDPALVVGVGHVPKSSATKSHFASSVGVIDGDPELGK